MINLLSPIEKKKIQNEYRLRLGITSLVGMLFLEVFACALLIPSYIVISSSTKELALNLEQRKSITPPGGDTVQNELNDIKKEIALLKSPNTTADILASSVMSDVLSMKPEGIDITVFAAGNTGSEVTIQIGGMAQTRGDLLLFQRSLKNDKRFSDIQYAQSFITKKTDINFQLTVKLK